MRDNETVTGGAVRVSNGSLDHGHDVWVIRLQEIGWKGGVSLVMCFIDLHKSCDAIDRTLQWR